jgi:hypothetical protein
MMLDPDRLLGGEALGDALDRLREATQPRRIVVGWATVELDRAEAEVGGLLGAGPTTVADAPADRAFGAACRILRAADGREVVLLEPSTEGLLAAGLARHGEGNLVAYLVVDGGATELARSAGFTLASERDGPFGRQRLVLVEPRHGPFLVIVGLG